MGEGSGGEGECGGYVGDVQELYVGGYTESLRRGINGGQVGAMWGRICWYLAYRGLCGEYVGSMQGVQRLWRLSGGMCGGVCGWDVCEYKRM